MKRQAHDDDRDPVLDAGLAEILGDVRPPDLAPRILRALERVIEQGAEELVEPTREATAGPLVLIPEKPTMEDVVTRALFGDKSVDGRSSVQPPPINGTPQSPTVPTITVQAHRRASDLERPWMRYSIALVLLIVAGGVVSLVAHRLVHTTAPTIAETDSTTRPRTIRPRPAEPRTIPPGNPGNHGAGQMAESKADPTIGDHREAAIDVDGLANARPSATSGDGVNPDRTAPPSGPPSGDPRSTVASSTTSDKNPSQVAEVMGRGSLPSPSTRPDVIAVIDGELRRAWSLRTLTPSEVATDEEWCGRVFVRLIGRTPTAVELRAFTQSTSADKRALLVSELVRGSQYADQFASHWATFWANALIGRAAGTRSGDLASREGFELFLKNAIAQDRPFHKLVHELVTASGTASPGSDQFNGAVNFLLAHHSPDGSVETGAVTRLLLGQRFQCAQCHDHPANSLLAQRTFWQTDALFGQIYVVRDPTSHVARIEDRDMRGDAVFFEQPDGVKRVAYPVLPDGTELSRSGRVADGRRRDLFARWIAQSDQLPAAVVNRMWAHFFGYGLTRPIDEIGPHNPGRHPELLAELSTQFAAHGYRLPDLMEWLALSDAFGRSSKFTEGNLADAPERGETPWFSRYYMRQIKPEAVANSLRLVAEARRLGGYQANRLAFLGQFAYREGTGDGDPSQAATIQSALLTAETINQQAVTSETSSTLKQILSDQMTPTEKVNHLFLASVARLPRRHEVDQCLSMIGDGKQSDIVLQDIWWALLNSNEFILNH